MTKEAQEQAMTQEPPEIVEADSRHVRCDGGGGPLGHPLVYLNMGEKDWVECPYCDRRFVLREGVGDEAASGY